VGDGHDRARVLLQVLLEPEHALGVEMVGRLVKQQQVRLLQQELAQRDPAALATGQDADVRVGRRAAQRVHGLLKLAVEVPRLAVVKLLLKLAHLLQEGIGVIRGHLLGDLVVPLQQSLGVRDAVLDIAEDCLALIQPWLLIEHADREPRHQPRVAIRGLLGAGHEAQQRRLTGAVGPHHADFRTRQEGKGDVVENDLVAVRFPHRAHLIDELGHVLKGRGCRAALCTVPSKRRCALR
jgi:hypothetical protein